MKAIKLIGSVFVVSFSVILLTGLSLTFLTFNLDEEILSESFRESLYNLFVLFCFPAYRLFSLPGIFQQLILSGIIYSSLITVIAGIVYLIAHRSVIIRFIHTNVKTSSRNELTNAMNAMGGK